MHSLIVVTSVSVETTTHYLWFSSGIGSRVRNRTLIGYSHIVTSWSHFKSLHCNIWNMHKEWSHIRSSKYPPKRSTSHPPLLYHIVDSGFLSFPTILSSMRPHIIAPPSLFTNFHTHTHDLFLLPCFFVWSCDHAASNVFIHLILCTFTFQVLVPYQKHLAVFLCNKV